MWDDFCYNSEMKLGKTQRVNKEYYDKNAENLVSNKIHTFYAESAFRAFVKHLHKRDKVLDIGCGHGREVPLFLGIGHEVKYEGLDISEKFIEIAKSRYPQLKFHLGNLLDAETLPSGFDGFWAASTLQHIPAKNWPIMLENLERIMNSSAVGYFSVPNDRPNPVSEKDPRHFTLLNDKQVRQMLEEHYWKIVETGELPATRSTDVWRWYICKLP